MINNQLMHITTRKARDINGSSNGNWLKLKHIFSILMKTTTKTIAKNKNNNNNKKSVIKSASTKAATTLGQGTHPLILSA